MSRDKLFREMTITEVLTRWPETAQVFHEYNMACVGCVVAPFYTIADAADVYGLSPAEFAAELLTLISGATPPPEG